MAMSSSPVPTAHAQTGATDYDADDDGLIEVSNLAQLYAIRYDLNGDGAVDDFNMDPPDYLNYMLAYSDAADGMGCPASGCTGYELTADLDFDTNGNGQADAGDDYWNGGAGWRPIGVSDARFTAMFDGDGHTIRNLYINSRSSSCTGLFGYADGSAHIRGVGLTSVRVEISGSRNYSQCVGGLVGYNDGFITDSYVIGGVSSATTGGSGNAYARVGGLVGYNYDGIITNSYAIGNVSSSNRRYTIVGGLVGRNDGFIMDSYATGGAASDGMNVGGLVGSNFGEITASYAKGSVSGLRDVGGLAGDSTGVIASSYAISTVSSKDNAGGGLVGGLYGSGASISQSYASANVSRKGNAGGLVGYVGTGYSETDRSTIVSRGSGTITSGFWNKNYGLTSGVGKGRAAGAVGKTTGELQSPTNNNPGIYSSWDPAVWDFGTSSQYPKLWHVGPTYRSDYDADDDGLIEVSNLVQLDAIRYDLDGDGTVETFWEDIWHYVTYAQAFPNATDGMGCPSSGCIGYELTADLDFDANGNGYPEPRERWNPIGYWSSGEDHASFDATFDGDGHTISNLHINRGDVCCIGLFGFTSSLAAIRQVGVVNANLHSASKVGGLVGLNQGVITGSYVAGDVFVYAGGDSNIGGLVGENYGNGVITDSYAIATVTGNRNIGGLVGRNSGTITGSYSAGSVSGHEDVGGLVGENSGNGAINNSYATGDVTRHAGGGDGVGGLVGGNYGSASSITHSYATGLVTSSGSSIGGLVGYNGDGYGDTGQLTNPGAGAIVNSYWDTQTSGRTASAGGIGKTTDELKSPTNSNPGIYSSWDAMVWDFGGTNQYPMLRNVGAPTPTKRFASDVPQLYWVDEAAQKIQRTVGEDGAQSVADLATSAQGLTMPGSIALDPLAGKMYWTDDGTPGEPDGAIRRANLDGSNVENVKAGLRDPVGIALDLDAGYLYWADRHWGNIYRGRLRNISNLTAETVVSGLTKPYQIALDTTNGHMYWTERGEGEGRSKIRRADLDGQNVTNVDFQPAGPLNPYGLTLDPIAGKIYWTERSSASTGQDFILSADLDGGNVALVTISEYHSLSGIAVDVNDGKIYWTDETTGTIRRADPADADPPQTVEDVVTGLSTPEGIAVAGPYLDSTRLALTALYRATDGPNWTNNDGWLSDSLPGTWHGVTTDDTGRVQKIILSGNNLAGHIPEELGSLANLETLTLRRNELSGGIPIELSNLDNLGWLNLEHNQLTGQIPAWLGGLTKLRGVGLGHNRLNGEIPVALGNLNNLTHLYLAENDLGPKVDPTTGYTFAGGKIPKELGNLGKLEVLVLSGNRLTGPIDDFTWANLGNLKELDLSENLLEWGIPETMGELSLLERLNLSHNRLSGKIPETLGDLGSLQRLNLSHNRLSGEIPPELSYRSYRCSYTGGVGNLANLRKLDLSNNKLNGEIPAGLCTLTTLTLLDLSVNGLVGKIPDSLANLYHLEVLHLHSNNFTECTPYSLGPLLSSGSGLGYAVVLGPLPISCPSEETLQDEKEVLVSLYKSARGKTNESALGEYYDDLSDRIQYTLGYETVLYNDPFHIRNERDEAKNCATTPGLIDKETWVSGRFDIVKHFENWTHYRITPPGDGHMDSNGCWNLSESASLEKVRQTSEFQSALQNEWWLVEKYLESAGWLNDDNWLSDQPIGTWYGIKTNLQGLVIELDLSDNNLHGPLAWRLAALNNLVRLDLGGNYLTGSIPRGLTQLQNLELLNLVDNELHGCVPVELKEALLLERVLTSQAVDLEDPTFLTEMKPIVTDGLGGALRDAFAEKKFGEEWVKKTGKIGKRTLAIGPFWSQLTEGNRSPTSGQNDPAFEDIALMDMGRLGLPPCPDLPSPPISLQSVETDRAALMELYRSTGGLDDKWKNSTNWGSNKPLNEWFGITTDADGRVQSINLSVSGNRAWADNRKGNGLSGNIPEKLGNLGKLVSLNLSRNNLTGAIPATLGNLSNLHELALNDNQLSNNINADMYEYPIPPELGNLDNLEKLYLQKNDLVGRIPPYLGNISSENLRIMDIDRGDDKLFGCIIPSPELARTAANSEAGAELVITIGTTFIPQGAIVSVGGALVRWLRLGKIVAFVQGKGHAAKAIVSSSVIVRGSKNFVTAATKAAEPIHARMKTAGTNIVNNIKKVRGGEKTLDITTAAGNIVRKTVAENTADNIKSAATGKILYYLEEPVGDSNAFKYLKNPAYGLAEFGESASKPLLDAEIEMEKVWCSP